jgi:hypothetical protein
LKPQIYFAVLFTLLLALSVVICLLQPMPLRDFTGMDCVWWLRYDQQIHREHLNDPPGVDGSPASHQQWIDDFEQVINRIEHRPSKLTTAECIQLLYRAQSTHAGWNSTDYFIAKHHYEWWTAYANIIKYMESER